MVSLLAKIILFNFWLKTVDYSMVFSSVSAIRRLGLLLTCL